MRFSEITSRLTGLSCAVFGASWTPPPAEVTVARRVIRFLEDRRVLYVDSSMEVPSQCVSSVLEIRRHLTEELQQLTDGEFVESLRAMRAACRKFLTAVDDPDVIRHGGERGHWASWSFNGALGELRGVFGVHLATIAARNGLDVEDELSRILPGQDADDRDHDHRSAPRNR